MPARQGRAETPIDVLLRHGMADTDAVLRAIDKHKAGERLIDFIKLTWECVWPGKEFLSSWAAEAIAEHLEAVTNGEIDRLLINCPPGCTKSSLVSIWHPAWEWGPKSMQSMGYITGCFEEGLALKHHGYFSMLIKSDMYQELWGDRFHLTRDRQKLILNNHSGMRYAVGMVAGSVTGQHGNRIIVDDPHSVKGGESEVKREDIIKFFSETLSSRFKTSPAEPQTVTVVMQRVHEHDVSGHILSEDLGYEHVCLPMRFESDRRCSTSIGFVDPRKEDGELLMPDVYPLKRVEQREKDLGSDYAIAGQMQQRPVPRSGGMFDVSKIEVIRDSQVPAEGKLVRGWDLAGSTKRRSAYTAGVLMKRVNGVTYVVDVVRFRAKAEDVPGKFESIALGDPAGTIQDIPQDPGSAGMTVAKNLTQLAPCVYASTEGGNKEDRAQPLAAQVAGGFLKIVEAPWNKEFLDELGSFPSGRFKDQVDAASRAYARIMPKRRQRGFGAPQLIKRTI